MTDKERTNLYKQMRDLNWLISFVNDLNYTRAFMQSLVSIRLYVWSQGV